MLLVVLAGMNAINAQNARTAWLNSGPLLGIVNAPGSPRGSHSTSSAKPLWWLLRTDYFGSQTIYQVDVAATGPGSPVPPGIPRLPGPGQFYASPALSRLLRSTPANELAARFPGHQIGTIGPSALPSPSSLVIVVGCSAQQLSKVPGAAQITSINTNASIGGIAGGFHTKQLETILAVGALALLLPVLVFIGTAARLPAARREQRFAAMRLVGATPSQIAVLSTVEASSAALWGVAIGFGLFYGIRPALTDVAFTGQRFAPGDLSLGLIDVVVVAIGIPIAAAVSARFAMRRAQISPLGVTRRVTPPARRAPPGRQPERRVSDDQWAHHRPLRRQRLCRGAHHDPRLRRHRERRHGGKRDSARGARPRRQHRRQRAPPAGHSNHHDQDSGPARPAQRADVHPGRSGCDGRLLRTRCWSGQLGWPASVQPARPHPGDRDLCPRGRRRPALGAQPLPIRAALHPERTRLARR